MKKYVVTLAAIVGLFVLSAEAFDEQFCYGELYDFVAEYDTATTAERAAIYERVTREWREAPFMSVEKKKLSWLLVAADTLEDEGRLIRSVYYACENDTSLTKESN